MIDEINLVIITLSSMAPGFEARYAAPLAISLGMKLEHAILLTFPTSLVPALILLMLSDKLMELLKILSSKRYLCNIALPIYNSVIRARETVKQRFETAGYIGLALFVAIPLPLTGVWTASIGASLLGLNKYKSFIAISIGNLIAIAITTGLLSIIIPFSKSIP